jgi:uncharacterized protein YlxP (DUF503 family)
MKIPEAIQEWADTINTPLEEGESLWDRQIAQQEAYVGMFDQISAATEQALADAEAWTGHELVGEEKRAFLTEFLEKLKNDYPIVAEEIQHAIDNLQGEQIDLALVATTGQAEEALEAFFANADAREVAIDMLIKAGSAPEDAAAIVDKLGEENVVEVITKAVTDLANDDINALKDEERVAEVSVDALLDAANDDMDDFITPGTPYSAEVAIKANLVQATIDINKMRTEAAKPIYVRVIPIGGAPQGGSGQGGGVNPDGDAPGTLRVGTLMSPTQTSASAIVPYGRGYAVTAGQPIVHNTRVTVNVPTADPSAVVRALQKWTRSNGNLPIGRGRG